MKRLCSIHLFVLLFFVVTCIVGTASFAQEKVITITVSNWFPVGTKHDLILQEWGKDLEKRTGGKVKVSYHAAGTLVPAKQSYDAVVKGITDVSNHVLGYTMGRFPFSQVLDLPIGWPQGPEATRIANEFYKKFKPKEFDDVKVLLFHGQPGGFLHTKTKPVAKLEEAKGLKLRCFGSNAKFVGNIGAAPVTMSMPDTYDALSKGGIDGLMSSYEALHNFRTGEFIKYSTENVTSAYSAVFIVMMNKKKFASLPKDIQVIIDKMSVEYIDKYGKLWANITKDGKDWLVKRGVKVISLSKDEQARWYEKGSKPLVDGYIEEMKKMGLPGDEAVKFLLDSLKKYH